MACPSTRITIALSGTDVAFVTCTDLVTGTNVNELGLIELFARTIRAVEGTYVMISRCLTSAKVWLSSWSAHFTAHIVQSHSYSVFEDNIGSLKASKAKQNKNSIIPLGLTWLTSASNLKQKTTHRGSGIMKHNNYECQKTTHKGSGIMTHSNYKCISSFHRERIGPSINVRPQRHMPINGFSSPGFTHASLGLALRTLTPHVSKCIPCGNLSIHCICILHSSCPGMYGRA